MIDLLTQAREGLASIHPAAPLVALLIAIWIPQWAARRWFPGTWELLADLPFIKFAKLGPWLKRARKAWQAMPSAMAGAGMVALTTGGDASAAAVGALMGLGVPVWHEFLKKMPGAYGTKPE